MQKLKFKILFILLIISYLGNSQNVNSEILKDAQIAFNDGDYYTASKCYEKLINDSAQNIDIYYRYAETLKLLNSYKEAAHWYKYVVDNDTNKLFEDAIFWLALMTKQTADYNLAYSYFMEYSNVGQNQKYILKSANELKACTMAQSIIFDSLPITIEHLGKNINTPYSEFNAVQLGDTALYFSSLRMIVSDEFESILPSYFESKIYRSKMSIAGFSKGKETLPIINNSETNIGNMSFNEDKTRLYYTQCKRADKSKLKCDIWVTENKSGKWRKPKKLPSNINSPENTNTQPSIVTGEEFDVLYFASDRSGGFGGMDIWYSIYKNEKYNDPINLGSNINTSGNEITPYYRIQDTILYFSSDDHISIGGFDVFSSKGALNQWTQPKNMGVPINSPANDIYFNINEVDNDGYLTSNRSGSYFIKGETCCNDIFYFEWIKKPLLAYKHRDTIFIDTTDIQKTMKDLLPLTLYFHNDEPDPATIKTTTELNYKTTLANYFELKDIYKNEYSKGLKGNSALKAMMDIEDFFNNNIKKGFTDLELFSNWLLADLQKGNSAKITIKGYTSPLYTAEYNYNLASRRISSLKNYISEFKGGVFLQYLNGTSKNRATLELFDAPIGKTESNPNVSDNPNDKRNSIYSKAAALERRIQIIMYESEKTKTYNDSSANLSIATKSIDFGKLKLGSSKTICLQFTNYGKEKLVIDSIYSISPNVLLSNNNNIISNNQKFFINIELNSLGLKGYFESEVVIYSNSLQKVEKIKIKAKVEE